MNKYYCQSGHQNFATNGRKPSYCQSCGVKMGASSFTSSTNSPAKPVASNQFRIINNNSNTPPPQDDYEEIPDIGGLSFELEVEDRTIPLTIDKVACGAPVSERPRGKRMTKAASKTAFNNLLSNTRTNVSKEI